MSGYCQPVAIRAPQGTRIAPAANGSFQADYASPLLAGLSVGSVYRFRVTDVPEHPGLEVFPTIELIDRTYPPAGLSHKYPVPIDLTLDELVIASEGKFVTRVIYIEDPNLALPIAEKAGEPSRWLDVRSGQDPLVTADGLGRPVAILRIGGRVPETTADDAWMASGPEPLIIEPTSLQSPLAAPPEQRLLDVSPPVNAEPAPGVIHAH